MGDMPDNDEDGDWPTKNWRSNNWGKGSQLFDHFQEHNFVKSIGCYRGCPIRCGRVVRVKDGKYKTPEHEGGEYESISVFTAYIMNQDVDAAVYCDYLCNAYGIDTISCGALIAFAMECYEKGILSDSETGGLDLAWGNTEVIPILIKMISERQGIGSLLAEGVRNAANTLGKGAEKFAIHVKGLEGPAHDPRSGKALAVTYATAARGMCHIHPLEGMAYDRGKADWGLIKHGLQDPETCDRWDESGKGKAVKLLQDGLILPDIVGTCKFMMYAGVTTEHWSDMLNEITGWDTDANELILVGERVINLQRLFNMREGFTRKDDQLPERVRNLPEFGKYKNESACAVMDMDKMLDEYYESRGWNKSSGSPTSETLSFLSINKK